MCIVRSLQDIGLMRATLKSFTSSKRNSISIHSLMRRLAWGRKTFIYIVGLCIGTNLIRKAIILTWRKLKILWSFEMSQSAWKKSFSNPLILSFLKMFWEKSFLIAQRKAPNPKLRKQSKSVWTYFFVSFQILKNLRFSKRISVTRAWMLWL